MAIKFIFLRSKFARRMFLLFFAAALIPVGTLAYLSYSNINEQLTDQSFERSRQAAKSFGLDVLSRLRLANLELDRVGALLKVGEQQQFPADKLQSAFFSIARIRQSDALPGASLKVPGSSSKPYFLLSPTSDIYLVRDTDDGNRFHGRFNQDFLFAALARVQGVGDVCIANFRTQILNCSDPASQASFQEHIDLLEFDSSSGRFRWQAEGTIYLTSFWSAFLRGNFETEDWTVYVSQTEVEAMGDLQGFDQLFIPVVSLALLIIIFVTMTSIRSRLAPLDQLIQATQKVSAGHIRQELTIHSGDEFEALADHFNAMTRRLDRQFQRAQVAT